MDIILDFDSTTHAAPSGFQAAMQYAAAQLDALLLDPVTVSISVSWNPSVFGEGGFDSEGFDYATVVAALKSHAQGAAAIEAAASLPRTDPNTGDLIYLSDAQAEVLGLESGSAGPGQDGMVEFGNDGTTLNFSTTDFAIPGEYDFVGIAEHELTHALGRVNTGSGEPQYLMDFYGYASPGVLQTNGSDPTYFSIDGGKTPLATFSTTSDLSDWAPSSVDDSFDAYANPGVANTISSADDTLLSAIGFDVHCFTPGTHILTPSGPIQVEQLAIGDLVVTKFLGHQRIKWIGTSEYSGRFIGANPLMLPVCIKRHALGPNIPAADLTVSPGHGIYIDNVLVPAWRLINGVTITQAPKVDHIVYYHIELATHDVITAENCPAESFLDHGDRAQFHNAAEYHLLYPGTPAPALSCAARIEQGFALNAIQRRLNRRAGLPNPIPRPGGLRGFIDIAGPGRVAGWAQCEADPQTPVCLDIIVGGQRAARILANLYRADLRQAGFGSGTHGFDAALPAGLSGPITVRRASDHAPLALTRATRAA